MLLIFACTGIPAFETAWAQRFDPSERLLIEISPIAADVEVGIPGLGALPKEAVEDAIPIYESFLKIMEPMYGGKPHMARGVLLVAHPSPCDGGEQELTDRLQHLYKSVWKPIQERLPGEVHRIIVSPDATLHFLPLAILLDEKDRFLIERYQISYVASGQDLLSAQRKPSASTLLVLARPSYGSARGSSAKLRLKDLPFTAQEARELRRLAAQYGWSVEVVEGDQARESTLRSKRSAPGILHLATHGVILSGASGDGGLALLARHPMHRGFLALAGAQDTLASWEGGTPASTADDGILTALEVGGLDLAGTWLVALSACDSGLGEAQAGEGVLGLRRGFAVAGAQHLLMALWPVDDQGTAELMEEFYAELFKTDDPAGALTTVQRRLLQEIREMESLSAAILRAGGFVLSRSGGNG